MGERQCVRGQRLKICLHCIHVHKTDFAKENENDVSASLLLDLEEEEE